MRRLALALAGLLAMASAARAAGWDRYQVILWHTQGATPAQLAGARRLGVTAGLIFGVREDMPQADLAAELHRRAAPLRAAGLGLYAENIATDFYSAYHRWRPDRPVTWAFDQVQARHQADRADPSVFMRDPGLSDPAWRARIGARLAAHVRALRDAAPLYYSLGDETGIADLTAAWDFDRAPASLAAFRAWLRGAYGTLAALNAEWGTGFADWDAVVPLSTDAALRLTDGNFAAWADFRAFMDIAFAHALRDGTDAVHAADPGARAGIEGAQTPGTGGYDYTHLARAVDVMEVTGGEPAFALAHALNPALVLLTTTYDAGPAARHALWRALLAGARGTILWDPDAGIARPDGTPGPAGTALAKLFAAFHGPAGQALLAAAPRPGPVAILYSPASLRTEWVLSRQAEAARGADWSRRRAETELADTALRRATRDAADALAHLGLEPRWLAPASLAGGGLAGLRAVILPHTLALSAAERTALRAFAAAGGRVLADIPPGAHDAHSRRAAPLAEGVTLLPALGRAALAPALAAAGIAPKVTLALPDGAPATDTALRVLRDGDATILGIQRDFAEGAAPETVVLTLPGQRRVRDLLAGTAYVTDRVTLFLDTVTPAVLAVEE